MLLGLDLRLRLAAWLLAPARVECLDREGAAYTASMRASGATILARHVKDAPDAEVERLKAIADRRHEELLAMRTVGARVACAVADLEGARSALLAATPLRTPTTRPTP